MRGELGEQGDRRGDKGAQEEESHEERKPGWKLCQCKRVEQARRWSGVASLELEEPKGEGGCSVCGRRGGQASRPAERAGHRWAESDAAGKATNPSLVFLNCAWVGSGCGD